MLRNGTLPGTQNMAAETKEKVLAKMRFGGKSVDELTEFCKKLSNGEASSGYLSNVSDDSDHDRDGNERPFNHPFVLKDHGPIVMNIRVSLCRHYCDFLILNGILEFSSNSTKICRTNESDFNAISSFVWSTSPFERK